MKARIELTDTPIDIIVKMSEGNPGAMAFMGQALKEPENLILIVLPLDTLEVYGSKIYMLWNDACDRDIEKVKRVIERWRTGELTKEEIHTNLNRGRALPFKEKKGETKW